MKTKYYVQYPELVVTANTNYYEIFVELSNEKDCIKIKYNAFNSIDFLIHDEYVDLDEYQIMYLKLLQ